MLFMLMPAPKPAEEPCMPMMPTAACADGMILVPGAVFSQALILGVFAVGITGGCDPKVLVG